MSLLNKFFNFREKTEGDVVKPFLDHMEDLRWMLIKMLLWLVVSMVGAFSFRMELMRVLQAPLEKVDPELPGQLVTSDIAGSFTLSLTMAFYAGVVVSLPFLLYHVAEFVLPALTRQEKRYLFPSIAAGSVLFLAGVLACYHWILPETLAFFFEDAKKMQIKTLWTWSKYASFCSWMTIGFGLLSELPVAVLALALLRLVSFQFLSRTRPYGYTLILILAAVVAPTPDPVTFVSLSIPIIALYEVCIWLVWLLDRRRAKRAALEDFPE
jgi:sec-independent protein translocase protein TatC